MTLFFFGWSIGVGFGFIFSFIVINWPFWKKKGITIVHDKRFSKRGITHHLKLS